MRRATFYMVAAARTVTGYAPGQGGPLLRNSFDNGEGKSTNVEPFFPGKTASDALLSAMHINMTMVTSGGNRTQFFAGSLGGWSWLLSFC